MAKQNKLTRKGLNELSDRVTTRSVFISYIICYDNITVENIDGRDFYFIQIGSQPKANINEILLDNGKKHFT